MSKRELSEAEKFYIEQHYLEESVEEMADNLPPGAGPKTVQAYVDLLPPPPDPKDSIEEHHEKLRKARAARTGKMMARDDAKRAVTMTEAASTMADARSKERQSPKGYVDGNKDRIHVMDKNKPVK